MTRRDNSYITRKIYFYRVHAGTNMAGIPLEYDITTVLEAIGKLDFDTQSRYLKDEDGYEICCWINNPTSPQKVIFGKIKRSDFPQVEHRGQLSDLLVPEESGLVECSHVMFFQDNIVGIEYNYDGPKVSRISEYLHVKSKNVCPQVPVFEELVLPDVIQKLNEMRVVKRFDLKVRNSLFNSSMQADEYLAKTLAAARELGAAREIELKLSVGRTGGSLGERVLSIAKNLILNRDSSKDLISGEIKGTTESGKLEIIDLLKAKLVTEKRIPKNTNLSGLERSEYFFSAIDESYEDLKDQLLTAVGVTLCPI